ncbi:MAG: peptidoglycan DD-metalloendopeptidase family protein [Gammaproteobacteria bacterium]|nr:peptidoglycan DD-metalloendopeptidase family protein [Gammaproteobacteria bacterium]
MHVLRAGLAALLLALALPAGAEQADPALTEAELKALQTRIAQAQAQRDRTAGFASSAEQALAELEARLNEAVRQLRGTEAELAKTRDSILALRTEKTELEQDRERQKADLGQQLRGAYATGRQDLLKLVLNQEDPEELGRLLAYYGYLSRARGQDISKLTGTLAQLKQVETALFDEARELDALKARQEAEQQSLAGLQAERSQQVAALKSTLSQQDKKLQQLKTDAKSLEDLLIALREELARMSEAAALKGLAGQEGKLAWPIAATPWRPFGSPSPQGLRATATEFRAAEGAIVSALHQGRVIFADWLRGYGLVLIVDHGEGWMSLYGHAQSLLKTPGDWVDAGEPVATAGLSGGQEIAGLYFEIRHQGVPVDAARFCRD